MLTQQLKDAAETKASPDGRDYKSLSLQGTKQLAESTGLSIGEVEIKALQNDIIPTRYQRNIGTTGIEGQIKLLQSHVGIAGTGGLGGTILEILARSGVGRITIADFDRFEDSNLNRQNLSTENNLGEYKVDAAVRRVEDVNPACNLTAIRDRLTENNSVSCFNGVNLIVDALGNIKDRFVIEQAAKSLGIPLVHAAVSGTSGQVAILYPQDPGLEAIYGPKDSLPSSGEELYQGTPPSSVTAIAAIQAGEAIKTIMGLPPSSKNNLIRIDLDSLNITKLSL